MGSLDANVAATAPVKKRGSIVLAVVCAGLPFVGGITLGWLSPTAAVATATGLGLWLCVMLILFGMARSEHKKFPTMSAFSTLVTFSATYLVCFLVAQYIAHPH